jgi:AraC-like ligand binding domain
MDRRRTLHVFQTARDVGPYDEVPVLRELVDPQVHLSRNDRTQPFFAVFDHDTLLSQMSGQGHVEFREAPVLRHSLEPGDYVYVPAGTPHRLVPDSESVNLRYKARRPGLEGAVWYCPQCGAELRRDEWHTGEELSQEAGWRVCQEFNANPERRRCGACDAEHPEIDLAGLHWPQVAAELRAGDS